MRVNLLAFTLVYWRLLAFICAALASRLCLLTADRTRLRPRGDCLHRGQRGDDLLRVRLERLGVLERAARRPERDARPARQKMEMEVEDLLAARRFVELLEQNALRPSCRP